MPSLIPGYEYDIFISYRQKDNKYDGWVTEFVDNLKKELEATFKEEISVYFDVNPHDGLLEMHDVNASLKEKLRCLIFIPVISRTYCDTKSFAWQQEFKAFIEQASGDGFGLKVKLASGNVSSRILPVRIHELDPEDKAILENELGGVLRAIEFIYKEPGVNRPLKPDDNEKKNLAGINYRNQINKTSNSIKEIISGLITGKITAEEQESGSGKKPEGITDRKVSIFDNVRRKYFRAGRLSAFVSFLVLLAVLAFFLIPRLLDRDLLDRKEPEDERLTVAVMPFQNITNDSTWNIWQSGIQNLLITSLSNSGDLKVRQIESITSLLRGRRLTGYASLTPEIERVISEKLEAGICITGSIILAGPNIRINAQLNNTRKNETFRAFQVEGKAGDIIMIIDSLSVLVKNSLIITSLGKEVSGDYRHIIITDSPDAYRYFLLGENAFFDGDFPTAVTLYSQALAIDTNFLLAERKVSVTYYNMSMYDEAKESCLKVYRRIDRVPIMEKIYANWLHAVMFETPDEEIKYIRQLQKFDDQLVSGYTIMGQIYLRLYKYDKAITEFQKAFNLYKKWGTKPVWPYNYANLAYSYFKAGQYKDEKKILTGAEKDFPDDFDLIFLQAVRLLAVGDTAEANNYIEKVRSICKEHSYPESVTKSIMVQMYTEGGMNDKAEAYYREILTGEPDNPGGINSLAYFLINNDRNIEEGLKLAEKAVEMVPDYYSFLHTKGWGLFKTGKYPEALDLLERSWELKPVYDHELFLHLEAARRAVSGMQNK